MLFLTLFLLCIFLTLAVGVFAGLSDIRTLKIPNAYSGYVVALFCVAYSVLFFSGHDHVFSAIWWHVLSAVSMFVVSLGLFSLKVIGAGDSKFGSACALWINVKYLPIFLFFMTVFGGLLGVVALILKKHKPFAEPIAGGWIEQVQGGASKVPYGVAISFGMLIAFIYAGYFSPAVLSSFVGTQLSGGGS